MTTLLPLRQVNNIQNDGFDEPGYYKEILIRLLKEGSTASTAFLTVLQTIQGKIPGTYNGWTRIEYKELHETAFKDLEILRSAIATLRRSKRLSNFERERVNCSREHFRCAWDEIRAIVQLKETERVWKLKTQAAQTEVRT
ncbi:hypothetical protein PMIN06_010651 [Paraphaeosphaeria minitans]